jgi:hypothetical protein
MANLDSLAVLPELQDALRPLPEKQLQGLRESIKSERKFLSPILWAKLGDGTCCVVDGHNRVDIWDDIRDDDLNEVSEPEIKEVEELRGCSLEQAIEWIKKHQANRRNDEDLVRQLYNIGSEWRDSDKTSAEIGEEYGLTDSQVRHAGKIAEVLEEAEKIEPGTIEKILDDKEITPSAIRNSKPEDIVDRAQRGADAPKGPLSHFEPLNRALANLRKQAGVASRAIKTAENETTECEFSEQLSQLMRELNGILDDCEEAAKNWQFDGVK